MPASSGKKYVLDDVEIDTARFVVRRAGEELALRPKTWGLLLYLVEHRGRLVPKQELMEQLWPKTVVSDGALAQCVADIRRALGEDARNPRFIRTAARFGYQFIGKVVEAPAPSGPAYTPDEVPFSALGPSETVSESASSPPPPARRRRLWRYALLLGLTGLCFIGALAAWRSAPPAREPEWWEAAWWKLNERSGARITDSVHGLTATLPEGVSWTTGISGSALLIPRRELVVRGNDPGVLPAGLAPRTIMAWVKTGKNFGDNAPVLTIGDAAPDAPGFGLVLHESGAAALGAPVHRYIVSKQRIDYDRWHQLAGVFEGPETRVLRLYVDGAEQASATLLDLNFPKSPVWTIGTGFRGGSSLYGAIDDARIFERVLRSNEILSLYRCAAGPADIDMDDGGSYYFAPVFGNDAETVPRRPGDKSAGARNTGNGFAGIMFVKREPDCGLRSVHGADIGQDVDIEMELRVPLGPDGAVTDAGPYFRSRRANPGDGIIGGASAGFWVRLDSTGSVRVQRLHPFLTLGLSAGLRAFDPRVFHKLQAVVHGESLAVTLDGHPVTFDVGGVVRDTVDLSPAWESASPKGSNGGSAGVAFGCARDRAKASGQEVRNIRVKRHASPLQ